MEVQVPARGPGQLRHCFCRGEEHVGYQVEGFSVELGSFVNRHAREGLAHILHMHEGNWILSQAPAHAVVVSHPKTQTRVLHGGARSHDNTGSGNQELTVSAGEILGQGMLGVGLAP